MIRRRVEASNRKLGDPPWTLLIHLLVHASLHLSHLLEVKLYVFIVAKQVVDLPLIETSRV